MSSKLKRILYFVIFYSGLVYLLRFIIYKIYNNPVCILYLHRVVDSSQDLYHFLLKLGHPDRETYEKKIRHLAKRYQVISLQECLSHIEKKNSIPRNCIVLTFDDGHRDLYRNAYPVLREKGVHATIFLTAGLIGSEEMLWFNKVESLIFRTKVAEFQIPELSDRVYKISSDDDRLNVLMEVKGNLKKLAGNKRDEIIERMSEILKVPITNGNLMLSWEEVIEMSRSGLMDFESHGMSHPILTNENEEDAEDEIKTSKDIIEQKLGKPVSAFAYPNGDFSESIKEMLKRAGHKYALSTISGINDEKTDPLELRRIGFYEGPLYIFGVKMACLPWIAKRATHKLME